MKKPDFTRLKELLEEQEKFPLEYVVKFVGKNTPAFAQGVARLEVESPGLKPQARRESSGGNHIALTYSISAKNVDQIIEVLERVSAIEDVTVLL